MAGPSHACSRPAHRASTKETPSLVPASAPAAGLVMEGSVSTEGLACGQGRRLARHPPRSPTPAPWLTRGPEAGVCLSSPRLPSPISVIDHRCGHRLVIKPF